MRTKFYFLLAAVAMFGFTACGDPNGPEDSATIKVYQGEDGSGVEIENNGSITVDKIESGEVIFDGYVENVGEDDATMKVKVELKDTAHFSQVLCQGDGTCLPTNTEYNLASRAVAPDDIAVFAAHCQPKDKTVAGECPVKYTFYSEENPTETITVNVTYKYTPAE